MRVITASSAHSFPSLHAGMVTLYQDPDHIHLSMLCSVVQCSLQKLQVRRGEGGERKKRGMGREKGRVGKEGRGGWEGEEGAGRQEIGAWIVKGGTARGSGRVGRGRGGVGSKREKEEECEV